MGIIRQELWRIKRKISLLNTGMRYQIMAIAAWIEND